VINLPPRHGKSLLINVFFDAWVWLQDTPIDLLTGRRYPIKPETWLGPGVRFMHITYKDSLATDHSVKCRQVIESDWYQDFWGDRFQFSKDQNEKTRYDTTYGGQRISASMSIVGKGGNILVPRTQSTELDSNCPRRRLC
jgi:hypothetical protein